MGVKSLRYRAAMPWKPRAKTQTVCVRFSTKRLATRCQSGLWLINFTHESNSHPKYNADKTRHKIVVLVFSERPWHPDTYLGTPCLRLLEMSLPSTSPWSQTQEFVSSVTLFANVSFFFSPVGDHNAALRISLLMAFRLQTLFRPWTWQMKNHVELNSCQSLRTTPRHKARCACLVLNLPRALRSYETWCGTKHVVTLTWCYGLRPVTLAVASAHWCRLSRSSSLLLDALVHLGHHMRQVSKSLWKAAMDVVPNNASQIARCSLSVPHHPPPQPCERLNAVPEPWSSRSSWSSQPTGWLPRYVCKIRNVGPTPYDGNTYFIPPIERNQRQQWLCTETNPTPKATIFGIQTRSFVNSTTCWRKRRRASGESNVTSKITTWEKDNTLIKMFQPLTLSKILSRQNLCTKLKLWMDTSTRNTWKMCIARTMIWVFLSMKLLPHRHNHTCSC